MSRIGKLCLIFSLFCLLVFAVVGYLSMFLTAKHFLPLYFGAGGLLAAVIIDFKFYKKFFFLKTTKQGLSIGASILLFFVLVVALNFIFFKYNKSWDLTSEKLHSLSDQTKEILKDLEEPLEFKVFLIKGRPQHDSLRNTFDSKIRLYKQAGDVNVTYINPQLEPALSKEYNTSESGSIILEYKDKRTEIETSSGMMMMGGANITEQDVTNAIIKVTRDTDKTLYFLSNHGEIDISSSEGRGGLALKTELEALSYQVKTLSFIETGGKVPEDADAILVLGPTQPLLNTEIHALDEYLKSGGNLLIAIDPEKRHGMNSILTTLGLKYKNEYVIDRMSALLGDVPVTALGVRYSQTSEISKKLTTGAASLFFMVSGFERLDNPEHSFRYDEIVQTDVTTVSISKLVREIGSEDITGNGPFSVVYSVTGSFDKGEDESESDDVDESEESEFLAIVYGDSDIFSNARIFQQLNRDLVLNTVSALLRDEDLINIRPKSPAQTMMASFTTTKYRFFNVIPFTILPLLLIIFGIVVSYRRKGL